MMIVGVYLFGFDRAGVGAASATRLSFKLPALWHDRPGGRWRRRLRHHGRFERSSDSGVHGCVRSGESKVAASGFLFPALFITIACGAISGFHSLVASGTTSKQLDKEGQALPIAYGGMLLESLVAIISLCAVAFVFTGYMDGHLCFSHAGLCGRPFADARSDPWS